MRSTRTATLALFALLVIGGLSAMSPPAQPPLPKSTVFIRVSGGGLEKPIIIANAEDISVIEAALYLEDSAPRRVAANVPPLQLAFFWKWKYVALTNRPDSLALVPSDSAEQWAEFQPAANAGDPGVVTYRARVVRTEHNGKTYIEMWGDARVGEPWALRAPGVAMIERYVKAKR